MRGLVWLRSDLRLDDNPSFESAFLECEEVMAVYFYSSEQWKNHHESNVKLDFLIQNLKSFSKGYFKPMLDLKESRLFAIETFKSHKGN